MDRIWAPWRIKYIQNTNKKNNKCILCKIAKSKNDLKNFVITREKYSFSLLNIYPYNNGHLMVVPYRHIKSLELLEKKEITNIMDLVNKMTKLLKKTINPEGFNIGVNIGKVSGAGIKNHIHIHIVPRWQGDTNFMPVIAETKVISQSLESLYNLLVKAKND